MSCASQKDKAWNYVQTSPTEFAEWCQERFPLVQTQYIPGKKEIIFDSILVPGETLECPEPTLLNPKPIVKTEDKYIPIQTEKCTADTIKSIDTREIQIKQNEIFQLRNKVEDLNKKLEEQTDQKNNLQESLSKNKSTKFYGWIAFAFLGGILIVKKLYSKKI